jgi:mRNA-degrading endonuclease toxin of MazEF toxin-antitoxin module
MINNYLEKLTNWFKLKSILGVKEKSILFREREIWWCSIGINIGDEQNGKNESFNRPVLILRKITKTSFVGLPMTSKNKIGSWYVPITLHGKTSIILLHQVRLWDSRRLNSKIGQLDWKDYKEVKRRFTRFYT